MLFPTEFDCSRGWAYTSNERHPQWLFAGALNNVYCAPLKIKKGSTHSSAKVNRKASSDISIVCVCVCVCLHPSVPATNNHERIDSQFFSRYFSSHGWMDPSYPFFFFFFLLSSCGDGVFKNKKIGEHPKAIELIGKSARMYNITLVINSLR